VAGRRPRPEQPAQAVGLYREGVSLMAEMNRGINLSALDTMTEEEAQQFRSFYKKNLGVSHPGFDFWIDEDRPDVLKRYRAYAEDQTRTGSLDLGKVTIVGGFLPFYALSGYREGIRFITHMYQKLGLSRSQVLEVQAVAFLYNGPRGSETVAEALDGYNWIEPEEPAKFHDNWGPDPAAFKSGIDYTVREILPGEAEKMRRWYELTLGEVPRYVDFLLRYRPQLLKSWRNRYENILVELPKQVMPYTQLHWNVMRGFGDGIRENILLARAFGMTKDQVFTSIFSSMLNAGPEALNIVDEYADDVLGADWPPSLSARHRDVQR
jgi:hypothetical protein